MTQDQAIQSHPAKLGQLTADTAAALQGIDGKLEAVNDTRNSTTAEFTSMRQQLHTWSLGVTAVVEQMAETSRSGSGPSSTSANTRGHSPSSGLGVDKKEVAVWKLPDDVSKV